MSECSVPQFGSCCCTCRWHVEDFHHCTTVADRGGKCVCSEHKGWICMGMAAEGLVHSGWSEHGMCEMHEPKPESAA